MEIRMPMWGMGMLEGTIVTWLRREGDQVETNDALAEVEAAKTTQELLAPASGTLEQILVPEGATVPVQELLAILRPAGGDAFGHEPESGEVSGGPVAAGPGAPPGGAGAQGDRSPAPGGAVRNVVPRARQLAKELGIDLAAVRGSGPGGRILVEDVQQEAEPAHGTPDIPFTGMRRMIAQRMHGSLRDSAQFTLVTTADVTEVFDARSARVAPRPSWTDVVIKAVALALREHPRLNATVEEEGITVHEEVHVGIAVALDDGLVVPVIRNADGRDLDEIADEARRLAALVRSGDFAPGDVTGSTFTVTSLGGQGIDAFTPIVNVPEVAILGVGRVVDQATRGEGDAVEWRKVLTLSLTLDHRAVDGAPGAAFLETVSEFLGSPEMLGVTA